MTRLAVYVCTRPRTLVVHAHARPDAAATTGRPLHSSPLQIDCPGAWCGVRASLRMDWRAQARACARMRGLRCVDGFERCRMLDAPA